MSDILGLGPIARSVEAFAKKMMAKIEFEPRLKVHRFGFVVLEHDPAGKVVDSWPVYMRWFPERRHLFVGALDEPKEMESVPVLEDWEPTDEALNRIAADFAKKLKKEGWPCRTS